ncbi:MAG: uracil-DNA glycosylase [Deltaproteobacteria bacterium]|nr:uracil-DNA glycosylase [Deltaproteobacteria bacterium]MBI3295398.1 uracil-DNA glycosylase [Deltaproteobacteria bacterium]
MLPEETTNAIAQEYIQLWKEFGVEPQLSRKKLAGRAPKESAPQLKDLEDVRKWLGNCQRCPLCKDRQNIVFGTGNPKAKLMFIGEGPGADEDAQGLPFVGRAGQLLTKIIEAMGYTREDVYIANIVKCRPPLNRTPLPNEVEACSPFLKAQIELVGPRIIVALGLTAASTLTQIPGPISGLRSRFQKLAWNPKVPIMPTYHPAYLLRNPSAKKLVWDDVKQVKDFLEARG